MRNQWQVVRCAADQYSHPKELNDSWTSAVAIDIPTPVAAFMDADDFDDFDWWHRCTVDVDEPSCIKFDGLTFPATVFVDGLPVAEGESMFLPVSVELTAGQHEITVCFGSLNQWLRTRRPRGRWRSSLVAAAGLRWARTTLIGRAPIYGALPAPVGFWRPIAVTPTRLTTRFTINADPVTGIVEVNGTLASTAAVRAELVLHGPSGDVVGGASVVVVDGTFSIAAAVTDPLLWWPHGYGPQHLYRTTLLIDGEPAAVRTFGFRTVAVASDDGGFRISVNDVPIFCRGATWSPPDPLRLFVDDRTMGDHVAAFADAGANMVRVVGGLVFEQDEFWEHCAKQGMMVWQDAMQATFDPPAEAADLIAREVAALLDAVSGNPALTVVSGGSETLQRPEMLGIDRGDFTMEAIDSLLPRTVADHAGVPYVRASPSPPLASDDLAIRPDTGVAHWFGVGGYLRPVVDVRSAGVRFAAECLAFANPPSAASVERYFGTAAAAGHHPDWKAGVPRDRGASWDFEDVRDFYVREVFDADPLTVRRVDPERYLTLGRLAIAEAMLQCFAFWRQPQSGCSGALVLAGKDLVPGAGWGLLDIDGEPKAAMAVLRRAWAPIAVVLTNAGLSGIRIDLYNDTAGGISGELELIATSSAGQRTGAGQRQVTVPAHSALTFTDSQLTGAFRDLSGSFRFGTPTADGVEARVRFTGAQDTVRDAVIVHPRPGQVRSGISATASPRGGAGSDDDWDLLVASDVALRYVHVDAPGWHLSDNYFHLLAGSPYTVRLRRRLGQSAPSGAVSSIDCLDTATIRVLT